MQPDFWNQRWQQGQTGFHREQVNPLLTTHWPRLAVPAGNQVLVPLSGKSLDMVWLAEQGYRVLGVECSQIAIEAFFAEQKLSYQRDQRGAYAVYASGSYELLLGDFFELSPAQLAEVAAVYDRGSLVALPESMRRHYARLLIDSLPLPAKVLQVTLDYAQTQMAGPPFAVGPTEIERLYGAAFAIEQLAAADALDAEPRFRAKGVTKLTERVHLLTRSTG